VAVWKSIHYEFCCLICLVLCHHSLSLVTVTVRVRIYCILVDTRLFQLRRLVLSGRYVWRVRVWAVFGGVGGHLWFYEGVKDVAGKDGVVVI
jgi:hypothetical protein